MEDFSKEPIPKQIIRLIESSHTSGVGKPKVPKLIEFLASRRGIAGPSHQQPELPESEVAPKLPFLRKK